MKYIIYLLIGIGLITLVAPEVSLQKIEASDTISTKSNSDIKPDTTIEPVKDSPISEVVKDTSSPVDVVKDNPKGCDQSTEWIWEDGTCHAKEVSANIAPNPAPSTPRSSGGCELVYKYSNWNQSVARAVCLAESGGDTYAANYNDKHATCVGSFGLMQLACFWIDNPTDPEANMSKANEIYSRSGWSPWGAYTSGKYLKHL